MKSQQQNERFFQLLIFSEFFVFLIFEKKTRPHDVVYTQTQKNSVRKLLGPVSGNASSFQQSVPHGEFTENSTYAEFTVLVAREKSIKTFVLPISSSTLISLVRLFHRYHYFSDSINSDATRENARWFEVWHLIGANCFQLLMHKNTDNQVSNVCIRERSVYEHITRPRTISKPYYSP